MIYLSPLRYPGGKRKLANYLKLVCQGNLLLDGDYVEPYAGGASVALSLLFEEYVRKIYINDIDISVFAFWHSVLEDSEELCKKIKDTAVTLEEWERQRKIQVSKDVSLLEKGFSTFFLNRTNRSGIISGGVIGGREQSGNWLLDARYNKERLINRIQKIARYRGRIILKNLDAIYFLESISSQLNSKSLIYLDPPYFVKGQSQLYTNFYSHEDHLLLANYIRNLGNKWVVSYDDVPQIRVLYNGFRFIEYSINYSAQARYRGNEIMFFCNSLSIPKVENPIKVRNIPAQLHF